MELLGNASVNVNREIILPPFLSRHTMCCATTTTMHDLVIGLCIHREECGLLICYAIHSVATPLLCSANATRRETDWQHLSPVQHVPMHAPADACTSAGFGRPRQE